MREFNAQAQPLITRLGATWLDCGRQFNPRGLSHTQLDKDRAFRALFKDGGHPKSATAQRMLLKCLLKEAEPYMKRRAPAGKRAPAS